MDLNEYLMSQWDESDPKVRDDYSFPLAKRIECEDGFSLSVQASHGAYCSPRTNLGPWDQVEVGFPSDVPDEIMNYAEQPEKPTETVYGYVPIELVETLIAAHGGMKANVEFSGTPAALSPEAPLERRVGGAVPPAPTFEGDEK
ncbi:MAG: hypothetical protein QG602_3488 [Verrucomicrobiota bacterium]|nr:hypothetical protein [Verrucomicrobiota bacterium]